MHKPLARRTGHGQGRDREASADVTRGMSLGPRRREKPVEQYWGHYFHKFDNLDKMDQFGTQLQDSHDLISKHVTEHGHRGRVALDGHTYPVHAHGRKAKFGGRAVLQ